MPWSFVAGALRGDLGVSSTSGIDVDARVRVFAVGSLALLAGSVLAAGAIVRVIGPFGRLRRGFAAAGLLVSIVIVGALDRRARRGEMPGIGAAVVDRVGALVLPALVVGAGIALIGLARGATRGGMCARSAGPMCVVGVLVAEAAFGLPGLGSLLGEFVRTRDGDGLRGVALVVATTIVFVPSVAWTTPVRRSDRMVTVAAVVGVVMVAALVFVDRIGLNPAAEPATDPLVDDHLGRDALARALTSGRTSFAIASMAVAAAIIGGVIVGGVLGSLLEVRSGHDGGTRRIDRARGRSEVLLVAVAALLAGTTRSPTIVIAATSLVLMPVVIARVAPTVDHAWRTSSLRAAPRLSRDLVAIGVAGVGTLFVADAVWGVVGISVDGRATIGREIAEQLAGSGGGAAGAIAAAGVVGVVAWSLRTIGYGIDVWGGSDMAATASQSVADGRPQSRS